MPKFSIGSVGLALSYLSAQFKSASLVVYSGTQPATPEIAVTGGNVALATFTFASTPFSAYTNASGFNIMSGSFVATTVTPSNSGTATFARAFMKLVTSNSGAWT